MGFEGAAGKLYRNQVHYHILTAGTAVVNCKEESGSDAAPVSAHIMGSVGTQVTASFMD